MSQKSYKSGKKIVKTCWAMLSLIKNIKAQKYVLGMTILQDGNLFAKFGNFKITLTDLTWLYSPLN